MQDTDEIDLMEFFQTIWDGKFKIAGVILMAVLGVVGFFLTQPPPSFTAKTEVKPITSDIANRYQISNSLGFFEVYSDKGKNDGQDKDKNDGQDTDKAVVRFLDELFIEQLDTRLLFEDTFRKYAVLDKNDYETETDFNKAIIELAAEISLLPPINVDGTAKGESRRHWTIEFEFNDKEKWLNVLADVKAKANQNVRELIRDNFTTTLATAEKKKAFEIEDISTIIDNALSDYDRKADDRVAFLREQSAIARKLGVNNHTIETQSFAGKNNVVTNVITEMPLYLRGYEAIEKEIELIEARDNKEAFVDGFLELEQKKRQLEQDKTLERAEALFADTPVMRGDDFSAVVMTVAATEFESNSKWMLMLAMAVVLGGMVGTVYVLIANAMRKHNEKVA
ncbi:Wzz/FepE/Etk N-terminal domain-containing protein [Alphaproteobacteria bacterium]|nr:Wzz/FepE/Etk N-terminal domain-containing protein [Alphaproteobacteria bacterium]